MPEIIDGIASDFVFLFLVLIKIPITAPVAQNVVANEAMQMMSVPIVAKLFRWIGIRDQ